MRECYIPRTRSISLIINKDLLTWVIQKNTGAEEKWAQKKEELVKKIKENRFINIIIL